MKWILKTLMWLGGLVTAEALGKQERRLRPAAVRSTDRSARRR
ncbi:MAG: hypothetical protein WDZ49_16825 [Litorilinea sp.]